MPDVIASRLFETETWIFDLDNTLYPAACNLFAQVRDRIGDFIASRFELDAQSARELQATYFRRHGTTLRGLMVEHGQDPGEFLTYVHDIDVSVIEEAPALDRALARLPGRKLIFTNGSVAHAERVMARLGILGRFEGIFDIAAASYLPKPALETYRLLCRQHDIDPGRAVMVEDMLVNLEPAHALGMTTVWLPERPDAPAPPFVDHVVWDLADWLSALRPAGN